MISYGGSQHKIDFSESGLSPTRLRDSLYEDLFRFDLGGNIVFSILFIGVLKTFTRRFERVAIICTILLKIVN